MLKYFDNTCKKNFTENIFRTTFKFLIDQPEA